MRVWRSFSPRFISKMTPSLRRVFQLLPSGLPSTWTWREKSVSGVMISTALARASCLSGSSSSHVSLFPVRERLRICAGISSSRFSGRFEMICHGSSSLRSVTTRKSAKGVLAATSPNCCGSRYTPARRSLTLTEEELISAYFSQSRSSNVPQRAAVPKSSNEGG